VRIKTKGAARQSKERTF